jgi:hypothetical protein
MATLWLTDWKKLPDVPGRRVIQKKPLIDLEGLQECIRTGQVSDDDESFLVATTRCEDLLEKNGWSYTDALAMVSLLRAGKEPTGDYVKSEWCDVKGGWRYPADVYRFNYDAVRKVRNRNGLEVYMKFSIDESGALMLVLVQCHPST